MFSAPLYFWVWIGVLGLFLIGNEIWYHYSKYRRNYGVALTEEAYQKYKDDPKVCREQREQNERLKQMRVNAAYAQDLAEDARIHMAIMKTCGDALDNYRRKQ